MLLVFPSRACTIITLIYMQVDIFHPLTTLDWTKCSEMPGKIQNYKVHCELLGNNIYICCRTSSDNTRLFTCSSADLERWKTSNMPSYSSAFTTYRSQLVLVGGRENSTRQATNKLWTSDTGVKWQPSLPPMPNARVYPTAIGISSPECLVVAGGTNRSEYEFSETVIVLIENQWLFVKCLPELCKVFSSNLHDGKLYLRTDKSLYHCDLKSLVESCVQPDATKQDPFWSEIPVPEWLGNVRMFTSLGRQLISINDRNVFAYSYQTQTWIFAGICPEGNMTTTGSLVLSEGDILVVKGKYHAKLFKLSLRGKGTICNDCI